MIYPEILENPFFKDKSVKKFSKNKVITYTNEIPRNGYIIKTGTVRLYSVDVNGIERTVSFLGAGDLLAGAYILELSKVNLYFHETVNDVECLEFPISIFRTELNTNSELLLALMQKYTLGYYGSLVHVESLVQHRAQDKILKVLRYLLLRFGTEEDKGWMSINIRLTQYDIADMIGITRETVAVELGKLKKDGIVDYKSFTYRVNVLALGDMVDSSLWYTYRK